MRMLSIIVCAFLCALPLSAAWLLWYLFSIEGQTQQCVAASLKLQRHYVEVNNRPVPDRLIISEDDCRNLMLQKGLTP